MDLEIKRYETYEQLEQYCYRVASVVGLLSIEIFGYTDPATREYANALGKALQLTNILRDVREDLIRGRIYLPGEDLKRFGVSAEDLKTPQFIDLMRFEASRARSYYQESQPLLGMVHARSRASLWALIEIYSRLLAKIEASNYDVLSQRIALSGMEKSWIVVRAALR